MRRLAFGLGLALASATFAQEGARSLTAATPEDLADGRRLFDSQCTRCHGRDGSGGAAPSLQRPKLRRAPDDETLLAVVRDGISGTSMPGATWLLTARELTRVAAYVRTLGRVTPKPLPGDATRGRGLFEGKGGCLACHIVEGKGGWQGPELSDVGLLRGPEHLRTSILDPLAELSQRPVGYEPGTYAAFLPVRARLRDGGTVEGQRVNEDTFTIQVRDGAGRLHSFRKEELAGLEKLLGQSLMTSYRGLFSEAELDDLVAYLASLRSGE
jgi:putative heme-binding domain-containing protein